MFSMLRSSNVVTWSCDHVEVSWNLGTMGPLNHPFKYVFRCNKASRKPGVALWIGKPLHWLISVPYIGSLVFTIHHQLSLTINPYSPYFAWHVAVTIICLNQSFQETSIRGRKLLPPSRASIDESSEMELQQVGEAPAMTAMGVGGKVTYLVDHPT